jgi:hypothetical protein
MDMVGDKIYEVKVISEEGRVVAHSNLSLEDVYEGWDLRIDELEEVALLNPGEEIYLGDLGPDSIYVRRI